IDGLEGQLTATFQGAESDFAEVEKLLPHVEEIAGRILFGGWPTGVEVGHAMVHGGPFPATTNGSTTSVGTLAIERFQRPVAYQSFPVSLRPAPVQDANPGDVPQVFDGQFSLSPHPQFEARIPMTNTSIEQLRVVPVAGHDSMLLNL